MTASEFVILPLKTISLERSVSARDASTWAACRSGMTRPSSSSVGLSPSNFRSKKKRGTTKTPMATEPKRALCHRQTPGFATVIVPNGAKRTTFLIQISSWCGLAAALRADPLGSIGRGSQPTRSSGGSAIFSNCFPKFWPVNNLTSASGAFSNPIATSSFCLSLPSFNQPARAPMASGNRAA